MTTARVLDVRQLVNGQHEVLILRNDLPEYESSWEAVADIEEQFLDFNLEDKVPSLFNTRGRGPSPE